MNEAAGPAGPRDGPGWSWASAAASRPTRPASCCAGSPSPGTTSPSCPPPRRCSSSGRPPGPPCPASRSSTEVWDDVHEVPHVRLGQQADLVVVAPATADLLAKAAHGLADDLLTNTLLTARCPVVLAPGDAHRDVGARRHPGQRRHPAPPRRPRPRAGRGPARPARTPARAGCRSPTRSSRSPATCWPAGDAAQVLDLAGRHVVVSAGGTRERLDPVRFLGNRSSGLQGDRAGPGRRRPRRRGHPRRRQRRAAGPGRGQGGPRRVHRRAPRRRARRGRLGRRRGDGRGPRRLPAGQPEQRQDQEGRRRQRARPSSWCRTPTSSPSSPRTGRAPDIVVVGFAAETGDDHGGVLDHARAKLARKGCDLLVVNDVSGGKVFGSTGERSGRPGPRRRRDRRTAGARRPPWPT